MRISAVWIWKIKCSWKFELRHSKSCKSIQHSCNAVSGLTICQKFPKTPKVSDNRRENCLLRPSHKRRSALRLRFQPIRIVNGGRTECKGRQECRSNSLIANRTMSFRFSIERTKCQAFPLKYSINLRNCNCILTSACRSPSVIESTDTEIEEKIECKMFNCNRTSLVGV